ncbi:hypothetical protein ES705_43887 [subsurface metagenome]
MKIYADIEEKKKILIRMTSDFCKEHLNEEYKELCEKLILKMSRKRNVPFLSGRINIWATAIIHSIGQINFLFDKSFKPYASTDDICSFFGTAKSTTSQKAKMIRDMFKMKYWDLEFSTKHMIKQNPLRELQMVEKILKNERIPLEIFELLD